LEPEFVRVTASCAQSAECRFSAADCRGAAAVFALSFALIWVTGGRVLGPLDEGIYLDGAMRTLHGQVIYRDFFALTGPGTFAILSLIFKVFGVKLASARLLPAFDIAALAAGIYLLSNIGKQRNPWPGVAAVIGFIGLETTKPGFVSVGHRLDSAALILWSLLLPTLNPASRRVWFASGLLAAAACWCTPSIAIVIVAAAIWLSFSRVFRKQLPWHACGCVAGSGIAFLWLAAHGALRPFWNHMLWTAANYSESNRFSYGSIMGGFEHPAYASHPFAFALSVTFFMLPAILPVLVFLGSSRLLRWAKAENFPLMGLLLVSAAACLISTWPRSEVTRLSFVSAIFYGLSARLLASFQVKVAAALFCAPALGFFYIHSQQFTASLETVRGVVSGRPVEIDSVGWVLARIPPHSSVFIYPYAPNLYFLTAGQNPTRYSFLQPGMSTTADEASVMTALRRSLPEYLLVQNISPQAVLKIWPNTDPRKIRTDLVDALVLTHYDLVDATDAYKLYRTHRKYHAGG